MRGGLVPTLFVGVRRARRSCLEELFKVDARLAQNSAECSFNDISTVVGQGDFAAGHRVPLNFVAAQSETIKSERESAESAGDRAILEARKVAH
jgi:hypothetical protein